MEEMIISKLQIIIANMDGKQLFKNKAALTAAKYLYRCVQSNNIANKRTSVGNHWKDLNQINLRTPFKSLFKKATLTIKPMGSSYLKDTFNIIPKDAVAFTESYHAIKLDKKRNLPYWLGIMSVGVEISTEGRWDDNSRFLDKPILGISIKEYDPMIIGRELEDTSGEYKGVEEFQNWFCLAY
jgi:hypothetical protein